MSGPGSAIRVRPAAVAGTFYPRDEQALRAAVEACLTAGVRPERPHRAPPKALIAPHAGYVYSGPIAGSAYGALGGAARDVERVVLLGPSHFVPFSGLAVPRDAAFVTPLGTVLIDEDARREMLRLPYVLAADAPHAHEHSLEVQLPFLQSLIEEFRILPIAAGEAAPQDVGAALERLWGGRETLIVVSSDLSHYLDYDTARELDADTTLAILDRAMDLEPGQACGCVCLNGIASAARRRALSVELLDLRNSGDTTPERDRVVGYGAFALYPEG